MFVVFFKFFGSFVCPDFGPGLDQDLGLDLGLDLDLNPDLDLDLGPDPGLGPGPYISSATRGLLRLYSYVESKHVEVKRK